LKKVGRILDGKIQEKHETLTKDFILKTKEQILKKKQAMLPLMVFGLEIFKALTFS